MLTIVWGELHAQILDAIPEGPDCNDELRHVGDCPDLLAMLHQRAGDDTELARLHAMKFYHAASAWRSFVRVGQEAVDDLLRLRMYDDARRIMETALIPIVTQMGLLDLVVPVRAHDTVVLAWCGDKPAARSEMNVLDAYQVPPMQALELQNQRSLIEQIP